MFLLLDFVRRHNLFIKKKNLYILNQTHSRSFFNNMIKLKWMDVTFGEYVH